MLPGASDLFIACPRGGKFGLWVEMKENRTYHPSERRKTTWMAQEAFQERMRSQGYSADFAFGFEHGRIIVCRYMGIE